MKKPRIILNSAAGASVMGILGAVSGILGVLIANLLNILPATDIARSTIEMTFGMGVVGLLLSFTRFFRTTATGVGKPIVALILFSILGVFYGLLGAFLIQLFDFQEMSRITHGISIGLLSGVALGVFAGLIGAVNVGRPSPAPAPIEK